MHRYLRLVVLQKIEKNRRNNIINNIEKNLSTFPPKGDIKKLKGKVEMIKGIEPFGRLRVSNYRIIFGYNDKAVYILNIKVRGSSYKK